MALDEVTIIITLQPEDVCSKFHGNQSVVETFNSKPHANLIVEVRGSPTVQRHCPIYITYCMLCEETYYMY